MSDKLEVQEIIAKVPVVPSATAKANLDRAHKEVASLMSSTRCTLFELCTRAEAATTSNEAKAAFKRFNLLMGIYLNAAPGAEGDQLLRGVLGTIRLSDLLVASIASATSVRDALRSIRLEFYRN